MASSTPANKMFRFLSLSTIFAQCVSAQIRIHAPSSLMEETFTRESKPGFIRGSTATFGAPYYGMRVMGKVLYAESKGDDYCTPEDYDIQGTDGNASTNDESSVDKPTNEGEDEDTKRQINIVLIKRGESKCRFTTKVRVAEEHKKAHAVIIMDRKRNKDKDVTKMIMSDEKNFGAKIMIPSILISHSDGEKLIESHERKEVIVELVWDIPANNVVQMDVWMTPVLKEANDFMKDFKYAGEQLAYNMRMTPHYHVFNLPSSNDYDGLCLGPKGTHCAEDPDGGGPITGKEVVLESLRQLCIWETTAVPDPEHPHKGERRKSWKFWEYIDGVLSTCQVHSTDAATRFGQDKCHEDLMLAKSIDVDEVNKCMISTQDEKLEEQRKNLAWSQYAVRINGWRYAGHVEADGVTRAICSAYTDPVAECEDIVKAHEKFSGGSSDGIGFFDFIKLFVLFSGGLGMVLFLFKRLFFTTYIHKALREEVMLEVQSQLADYIPLEENRGQLNHGQF